MLVGDNFLAYFSSPVLATSGENESSVLQFILFYVPFVRMEYKNGFQNQLIFLFLPQEKCELWALYKIKTIFLNHRILPSYKLQTHSN